MADAPSTRAPEAPAREPAALPVMLPQRLIGRDALLKTVYEHLKQGQAVLLHGPAGVGKTALAATLGSAYTQQPGGTLWLHTDDDPLEALLVRVGRAYNDAEIANNERPLALVGAVTNLLARHRPLLVLDGAPKAIAVNEFVRRCAEGLPTLLTADAAIDGPWTPLAVPPLAVDDAAALFADRLGQPLDDAARLVAGALDGLPYAVQIAGGGARVNKATPSALLAAYDALGGQSAAARALDVAFGGLNKALQGILLILGATHTGAATLPLMVALSDAPQDTVQKVMGILAAAGFVERVTRYGQPVFRLHPLTVASMREMLAGERLGALRERVQDALLAYAKRHSGRTAADHDALAAELPAFLAAAQAAADSGDNDVARSFGMALTQAGTFMADRGLAYELTLLQNIGRSTLTPFSGYAPEVLAPLRPEDSAPDAGTDDDEAFDDDLLDDDDEAFDDDLLDDDDEAFDDDLLDDDDEGFAPRGLSASALEDSPSPRATTPPVTDPSTALREALARARQQRDASQLLPLLQGEDDALSGTEVLSAYEEALSLQEEASDARGALTTLRTLAERTLLQQGGSAAALYAARGAKYAEGLGDQPAQLALLLLLGRARLQAGDSAEAAQAFRGALPLARALARPDDEARALAELGFAQLDDGQAEAAVQTWNEALPLLRAHNDRPTEARVLGGLGDAYGELDRWSEAMRYHESALHILRGLGDTQAEADRLAALGNAAQQANRLGEAVLSYRQALHLAFNSDDRAAAVPLLVDLVRLLSQSRAHLTIARMLLDEARQRAPNDRDVQRLGEKLANDLLQAEAEGITFKPVNGTVTDYARSAYALLDV